MKKRKNIIGSVLLILLGLAFLSPFYLVFVNAFKNRVEIALDPLGMPKEWSLEYFTEAVEKMNFLQTLGNTVKVSFISVSGIIVLTSTTAWIMVRMKNKWTEILFYGLIATMIIPTQSIMMPLMQFMGSMTDKTGIPFLNSHFGLIYMNIGFGCGMGVFLYHGFIKSIPLEIEEAAILDGCNLWQRFWYVVFPMLKNITITVAILDVIWLWNDYLLPSLALSSKDLFTLPLSTFSFFEQYTIQWNLAMAGLSMTIIPVIVFYLAAQRYIMDSVASGALK